jgi:fibronectin-binding autotransporter adhesin
VITAPRTVTLDAGQTVGTLSFNSAQSYTLAGSNTLTLDNGTDAPQITDGNGNHTIGTNLAIAGSNAMQANVVNGADTLTISGAISGNAGLQKLGLGTVVLSGANTYTGSNTVDVGTLRLSGSGTLGNTANPVTINNTGVLDLGGTTQTTGVATFNDGRRRCVVRFTSLS